MSPTPLPGKPQEGRRTEFVSPFAGATQAPGISGYLRFVAAKWDA